MAVDLIVIRQQPPMFFHRNTRIKTEPKIAGRFDDEFRNNKRRLNIKNIRFSLDQEIHKAAFPAECPLTLN